MAAQHVADSDFQDKVLNSKNPVVVDFYATWCGPCKMMAPAIDELASEVGDKFGVYKLDVDENPETAGKYSVMSVPTLLFFSDGKVLESKVGVQTKEDILQQLESI